MEMKQVTAEEFYNFVNSYPVVLEKDLYMDWWTFNDFSTGLKWPESVVDKVSIYGEHFIT